MQYNGSILWVKLILKNRFLAFAIYSTLFAFAHNLHRLKMPESGEMLFLLSESIDIYASRIV